MKEKRGLEVVHERFVQVEGESVIGDLGRTRSGRGNCGRGKLTCGSGPRGRPSFAIVAV